MPSSGVKLELNDRSWLVVAPLNADTGGFGSLYVVTDDDGSEAIAKLVKKAPGAERELFIGTASAAAKYPNVMPVMDDGEHEDHWVLVMPRAEKSLAAYVAAHGELPVDEAVGVLDDIATALAAIDGEIIHRDVKPANVLLFQGRWCLTDFGISRYADATTAADTRKGFLSARYAAPEQWKMERATSAADVYAFGCVAYELLTGAPPFVGGDYREQHLNIVPPALAVGTTRLRVLIEECLYKAPGARPTPQGILSKLEKIADEPAGSGLAKLAEANRQAVSRKSAQQARLSAEQQEQERRAELHRVASMAFEVIGQELTEAIRDHAPSAHLNDPRISMAVSPRPDLLSVELNGAILGLTKPYPSRAERSRPFVVISEAVMLLQLPKITRSGWAGRTHSLWFCDAVEPGRFAWYETGFMKSPVLATRSQFEPFHLSAGQADHALLPMMGTEQVAWPFEELDRSDLTEFLHRWLGWFGAAAQGVLSQSTTTPEKPTQGTWRKD